MLAGTARPRTFSDEDLRRYREAWSHPGALTAMLNWYRALPIYATEFRPRRIPVPLRVIWGDRDPFMDPDLAEVGLALCDRGDGFHLPDATHWVQHEEPEHLNWLLIEFLA